TAVRRSNACTRQHAALPDRSGRGAQWARPAQPGAQGGPVPGAQTSGLIRLWCVGPKLLSMSIDFSVSEITDANLTGADLREALAHPLDGPWRFTRCDLSDADLKDTDLTGAVCTDCRLDRARLERAVPEGVVLTGGEAAGAVFAHSDCTDAGFERVDLANTRWQGALLTDTSFTGCRMTGAALTSLRGIGYTIAQCNLMLAQCKGIDLSGQNLEGLRMDEADLSGADLSNTVWVESRLREVSWVGASFAGADLRGADLGQPTLAQAGQLRGATITPAQAGMLLGGLGIMVAQ